MKPDRKLIILTLFGILLLTACAAKASPTLQPTLESTPVDLSNEPPYIIAEGIVIPEEKATLSFVSGGIVDEIFFNEGDALKKGDIIASLSGHERLNAEVASAELALLDAQNKLDTFLEEEALNRANAELALAQAKLELEEAQDNRTRKDLQRASSTILDGLRADFVLAKIDLEDWEEEYNYFEEHRNEDDPERAQVLKQLTAARLAYEKVANNLNYALGFPDVDEVAKADAQLNLALANVEKAQSDYDEVKEGPDPDQLALLEGAQKAAATRLASAERSLEDLFLTAPFKGQLVSSMLEKSQYIQPGETAVMIGNLDHWVIETTDLTELDIVDIKVGDKVEIQLDALPDVQVSGTVDKIKLLGENVQGDVTYTVTVKPDEKIEGLRWNMTAFMKFFQK